MSIIARIVDSLAAALRLRTAKRKYGWRRSTPDARDHKYVPSAQALAEVKDGSAAPDLRSADGPIFDQGQLGSCTANCWLGMFMFATKKLFGETFLGSRLQLYLDERKLNGNVDTDSGAEMRDGAKCLATIGVCPESMRPYDVSRYTVQPSADCYTEAAKRKIVQYMNVAQDLDHMKACLAEGFPFIFGFNVASSFESFSVSRTGIVPMPKAGETVVGGHCMEVLGYIDANGQSVMSTAAKGSAVGHAIRLITGLRSFGVKAPTNVFICRNSWGTSWGDGGYCYVPYAFLTDSKWCEDFWTVRVVTNGQ